MKSIIVTKLDAARRQLEAAALLYFNDLDIVSVHTLAAAAYGIVEGVAQKKGRSTILQRDLFNYLSEDLVKEVRKAMRSPQNFFKHADRDPDQEIEFEPQFTEMLMLDAMATYGQLTGEKPILFVGFANWFGMQNPELFKTVPETRQMLAEIKRHFGAMSRKDFLEKHLARATTIRAKLGT